MAKYMFEVEEEVTRCYDCPLENATGCSLEEYKKIHREGYFAKKPDWCPLEKVKEK